MLSKCENVSKESPAAILRVEERAMKQVEEKRPTDGQ
jgi:hypothetical protein